MYIPPHFHETDLDVVHNLIRRNSFATVVSRDGESMIATHVPMLFDATRGPHGTLRGHFARANPHCERLFTDQETLVIFHGPHAYVSPTWYASNLLVPTWNYQVVHAYGRACLVDDETAVRKLLDDTVREYESSLPNPWSTAQLPAGLAQKMTGGIVALEIEIARLEAKSKLSQNRSRDDQVGAIEGLNTQADESSRAVAKEMARQIRP